MGALQEDKIHMPDCTKQLWSCEPEARPEKHQERYPAHSGVCFFSRHTLRKIIFVVPGMIKASYYFQKSNFSTYGHSCLRTLDPVRSPHVKQANARLVVAWVTSSESRVLYVLLLLLLIDPSPIAFTLHSPFDLMIRKFWRK